MGPNSLLGGAAVGLFNLRKHPEPASPSGELRPAPRPQGQMQDLEELARHLDEDRLLLGKALKSMQPGLPPADLANALYALCFRHFSLAAFYLALMDWECDELHFPLYFEGGRSRPRPPRKLSREPGLTGKVLELARPAYFRTAREQSSISILTDIEIESGLIPQSWYGVPLGADPAWGPRPFGVLSFQSFHQDAFSESTRALMDGLGVVLAFALKADPAVECLRPAAQA